MLLGVPLVSFGLFGVLAVCIFAVSGEIWWAAAGAAALAACAALFGRVFLRARRQILRLRRLKRMSDRILRLFDSLPRRTEVETLAVLHEIRASYAEALELAEGLGDGGRTVTAAMRRALAAINEVYDVQSGSLRRTDANAADFAAAMRGLGRDVDGSVGR